MSKPFIPASCVGEFCFCRRPAEHKIEEVIFEDDPAPNRHPLVVYVCQSHFAQIMGPAAGPGSTWLPDFAHRTRKSTHKKVNVDWIDNFVRSTRFEYWDVPPTGRPPKPTMAARVKTRVLAALDRALSWAVIG